MVCLILMNQYVWGLMFVLWEEAAWKREIDEQINKFLIGVKPVIVYSIVNKNM